MKSQIYFCSISVLISALFFANVASATTQTITASARNGTSTPGNATVASISVVTCTQAGGGGQGGTYCLIQAPGWNGILSVGESIGTTGSGNVTLKCNGSYPASGGGLSCTAQIDDAVCSPEQTILASARMGGSTRGLAPIASAAIVECTQASGGIYGTTCGIQSPGWTGFLSAGQSIGTSGAGTVSLSCGGTYSANGGGLTCTAQVSQVCP